MTELLAFLATHGPGLAIGVLVGAALTCVWLVPPMCRTQEKADAAYLDGFEAGVTDAKAEANYLRFGRLGREDLR